MHILIVPSERYLPQNSPLEGIFQQHQARALARAGFRVGVLSPPELWSIRLVGRILNGYPNGFKSEVIDGIPVIRYYGHTGAILFRSDTGIAGRIFGARNGGR